MSDELRRQVFALLIVVAGAAAAGRVLSTELVYEPSLHRGPGEGAPKRVWPESRPRPMPTFGSNDRSRWATVRALVDDGTFVIGRRDPEIVLAGAVGPLGAGNVVELAALFEAGYRQRTSRAANTGILFEDGWGSVDVVLHPSRLEFYSTKPPLLTVLVAAEYWLLERLTGWTLRDRPQLVVRTLLLVDNVLPLLLYLALLARLAERYGVTEWGRLYVVACAAFGTLVTPFLITLNNHTPATFSVAVALYLVLGILDGGDRAWRHALAGLATGFAVVNELPALAFAAALGAFLLWRGPRRALLVFAPCAALPLLALAATNYAALGQLRPAYSEFGGPWYRYEGSHWAREPAPGEKRRGIDFAREHESQAVYAVNLLVGHHGVFSLTPFTLLTVAGVGIGLRRWWRGGASRACERPDGDNPGLNRPGSPSAFLFPLTALLSVVVVGFYIFKSDNYGGWTAGPRWLMWLTPLWLLALLPAVDRLAERRWGRALALALLALSVLSASYAPWNPWRHPWLYNAFDAVGWIPY